MSNRLKGIIKGVILSLLITLLLAVVLAVFLYFLEMPKTISSILIFLIAAIACSIGAYLVAKASGNKGLLTGAILGLLYYAVLVLVSFFIKKDISVDTHMLIMFASAMFSGMLGGVCAMQE